MSDFTDELKRAIDKASKTNFITKPTEKMPCGNCGKGEKRALPNYIQMAGSLIRAIPMILEANVLRGKNICNEEELFFRLRKCEICLHRANDFEGWENVLRCSLCGCFMERKAPYKKAVCTNVDPRIKDKRKTNIDYWT